MDLPITEKELEYIMGEIKHKNNPLYNKLWTFKFRLKYKPESK
jgi:hypothetical protein